MSARRLRRVVLVTAALTAGFAASGQAAKLEQIGTFNQPIAIAAPVGDPDHLYVVERQGTISVVTDGVKQTTPFLDIHTQVVTSGEQGLVSMAFAPDFATSHRFYVDFAKGPDGDIEVDEFIALSATQADPATQTRVISIAHHAQTNHYGGQLQTGVDGHLYISTGDGGGGGDTQGNGQNLTVTSSNGGDDNHSPLLGKILRIDPLPAGGYTIPADNPFPAPAAEVWMLGLRNPWRWSFDRTTGAIVIGDVGQEKYEEIDYVPPGGIGPTGRGLDFGWNIREGLEPYTDAETAPPGVTLTDPVLVHDHANEHWASLIGGYIVRDPQLTDLYGTYVYGDNSLGQLWDATLSPGVATGDHQLTGLDASGLSGMGEDACARVYIARLGGAVQRFVPDSGVSQCTAATLVAPAGPVPETPSAPRPPSAPTPALIAPAVLIGDRVPPRITVLATHLQHPLRTGRLSLQTGCSEHCALTLSASLHVGRHVLGLTTLHRTLAAAARVKLVLRLSRHARSFVRGYLRRHVTVRAVLRLRALDAAHNATTRIVTLAIGA